MIPENKIRFYPGDPPLRPPSSLVSYFLPGYSEQQVSEVLERESKRKHRLSDEKGFGVRADERFPRPVDYRLRVNM